MDAAKLALETSRISNNTKDRINSVITHLEAAHIAYSKRFLKEDPWLDMHIKFNFHSRKANAIKDLWVCSLLALSYAGLEDYRVVSKYLDFGDKALEEIRLLKRIRNDITSSSSPILILSSISYSGLGYLNPKNISSIKYNKLITEEEFKKLKAVLQSEREDIPF